MNKRRSISKTRPQNAVCATCGKRLHLPPSEVRKVNYCSSHCNAVAHATITRGTKTGRPAWNRLGDEPLTPYERVRRYIKRKRRRAGKMLCQCGCGEMIPALNAQGNPAKYKQGHQPGNFGTTFKKGLIPYNKGKKGHPAWNKGIVGQASHFYVNGNGYAPYPGTFNNALKERIRERDNHICQLCGKVQETGHHKLDVHHIDYNKKNCNPSNLIALCNLCNLKVNFGRDDWTKYFRRILRSKNR